MGQTGQRISASPMCVLAAVGEKAVGVVRLFCTPYTGAETESNSVVIRRQREAQH